MRDPPGVGCFRCILLARHLFAGRDVPEAELGGDLAGARFQHAAGQDELRVHRFPGVEAGPHIRICDLFGKAGRIDRQQEYRTGEIVSDDAADLLRAFVACEGRDRHRHRFEIRARMHIDVACGGEGGRGGESNERCAEQRSSATTGHDLGGNHYALLLNFRTWPLGGKARSLRGDLGVEGDGLGFPLIIKGAILGRDLQRVAGLHRGKHALGQSFELRIGRRIDEFWPSTTTRRA